MDGMDSLDTLDRAGMEKGPRRPESPCCPCHPSDAQRLTALPPPGQIAWQRRPSPVSSRCWLCPAYSCFSLGFGGCIL